MVREFSAGGVVVRRMQGRWWLAAIEPEGRRQAGRQSAPVLALPKGLVDKGEKPEQAALREVREETGVEADLVSKLTDIRYFYVRSWGDKERVFKVVSFFLLKYRAGKLGEITPEMRTEVREALWLPLEEATSRLNYKGESDAAKLARQYITAHPEL